ncbi:hypothetical protein HYC85_025702 [Camellia sinensis]|uniref:Calcium-transporting ATPase n=1 Tax=Camellia sinensis TaxID=4442 RepID=A0A7J7GFS8_CAMSI|nr:hypothetical protein HYC85_025702 [Camellia sinensis]
MVWRSNSDKLGLSPPPLGYNLQTNVPIDGVLSSVAIAMEELRVFFIVQRAAVRFLDAAPADPDDVLSEEARAAGFRISPYQLASLVRSHDTKWLEFFGEVDGIATRLNVPLSEGVKTSDIPIRQKTYGFNKHTEKPSRSFWMFDLPLMGGHRECMTGLGIILSIFLVVIVTAVSDYNQSLQFKDLDKEKKKIIVQVTRDGYRQKVEIYDLVVGDIVHLFIGDQVPADGLFISGYSLVIDESSLSGESEPVNICKENPFLLGGTMVKLNGVATIIGKIGLGFAVLTFLVLIGRFLLEKAIHHEFTDWSSSDALELLNYFAIAVTILVVAVPEGLPLAVTLSLAFAMKKLMDERALVRNLAACETMGSATCICTDKTGTLTTNHMVVNKIWICGKETEIKSSEGGDIPEKALNILLQTIFQNTGAEVVKDKDGKNSILGTATESALLEYGLLLGGDFDAQRKEFKILKVEPFNSVKKKMSVLVALPDGGLRAFCKGASEIILRTCDKIVDSNGEPDHMSEEQARDVEEIINSFASKALRTLCLTYKDIDNVFDENSIPDSGYTLIAVVGIKDPVRPGVKDAVKTCLAAGITVRMVTGDNINTAKAIATECGILTEDGLAIEGLDFRSKSQEELKDIIPRIQVMARSSPSDKHMLVTHLRNMFDEVVAVTGDGTNDAPALHESDIGLAMGIAGTEVAKESADVIILDDNFSTIVNLGKWGRAVYINIQKFVQFQLTVNVVALMLNFVSACITGSAPLTAVQLLWVNLIMDTLGALALATEPPNDGLMNRPPVGRGVSFITMAMWRNIIGQSIYQLAVLGVLYFDGKNLLRLEGSDASDVLDTLIFNTFVFCQMFNEINSRDIEKINVFRNMFNSWIFIAVMSSTVTFQVIIVEFLGAFASTVPLSWQFWLLSILIGSVSIPVAVVLKCIPVVDKVTPKHHDDYEELPSGPETA